MARNIKLIIISNLLIFISAFVVLNFFIPKRFQQDAYDTVRKELVQIKQDVSDDYVFTYLSSSIQFIYPIDLISNQIDTQNASYLKNYLKLQNLEKQELIEYASESDLLLDECYTYKTDNGIYVFTLLEETSDISIDKDSPPLMIYINIKPFFRYNYLWNIILVLLFIIVLSIIIKISSTMNKEIEMSREAERRFFQNSSHELKTPLMTIQGYAEAILSGVEDSSHGSLIILEESSRMTKLINDLLFFSMMDSGSFKLHLEITDIRELIYDSMNSIKNLADKKSIIFNVDMPNYSVPVYCDEKQTIKALDCLLSNAVNYAYSKIDVSCSKDETEVMVKIKNDGQGINDKDLPYIFERFYTSRSGGTGIGLALAKDIITMQKGTISVNSNNEEGTCFVITMSSSTNS